MEASEFLLPVRPHFGSTQWLTIVGIGITWHECVTYWGEVSNCQSEKTSGGLSLAGVNGCIFYSTHSSLLLIRMQNVIIFGEIKYFIHNLYWRTNQDYLFSYLYPYISSRHSLFIYLIFLFLFEIPMNKTWKQTFILKYK